MKNTPIELRHFVGKLAKDTIAYIPAKFIPGAITVLSVAIFTRIFDPSDYGIYILVFTTITVLIAVFSQWVTQSTLRYRAQYTIRGKLSTFNRNLFRILLLITICISFLALCFYPFRQIFGTYQQFLVISVLMLISGVWFSNLIVMYQADLRSSMFSIYTVINAIIKFVLALALIFLFLKNISCILWGIIFGFCVTTFLMMFTFKQTNENVESTAEYKKGLPGKFMPFLKQFFVYGFPMTGWFLGAQLLNIADRYLLQIFRSSSEIGIYSSNYNLVASAILFVSMPLLTAAHPLLMKAGTAVKDRKEEIQELIAIFSRYFLLIAIPIVFYVAFQAKELADIFLGAEFREGNTIIPIVLLGLLAWNFAMFGHKGLEFREKTNKMFLYVMICTVIKIILNIIFIPNYGYIAAAVTTSICFFIYPILVYFGTKSDIKWIIPWISVLRISTICIIINGFFILTHKIFHSSILLLTVTGVIMVPMYLIGLYLIGELKQYELVYFKKILRFGDHPKIQK